MANYTIRMDLQEKSDILRLNSDLMLDAVAVEDMAVLRLIAQQRIW
jgi:hypothetical protein